VARLRKQARLIEKRRQALWEREKQNIDELEVNKAASAAVAGESLVNIESPVGLS
jgi:hypothetical protein